MLDLELLLIILIILLNNLVVIILLLKNLSPISILLINILICAIWHLIIFILCITINKSVFNYKKTSYKIRSWEKNGKIYEKTFKIKKWKDLIPQHIGKNGFSKRHFESLSPDYINKFIFETCRAEWNHKYNCIYSLIAIIINPLLYGLFFSILTFIFNLACVLIQRYNRIRLLKIKARLKK